MSNLFLDALLARERHAETIRRAEARAAYWDEDNWAKQHNEEGDGIVISGTLLTLILAAFYLNQMR